MATNFENRIAKLEAHRGAKRSFVIRVSDPKTRAELAELAAAATENRNICVMPFKCATSAEWLTRHADLAKRDA
jgi:hypothetical protein